jgi:hypothetical protein
MACGRKQPFVNVRKRLPPNSDIRKVGIRLLMGRIRMSALDPRREDFNCPLSDDKAVIGKQRQVNQLIATS